MVATLQGRLHEDVVVVVVVYAQFMACVILVCRVTTSWLTHGTCSIQQTRMGVASLIMCALPYNNIIQEY